MIEMVCEYPDMVGAWEWVRDMDGYSSAFIPSTPNANDINDMVRMPMLLILRCCCLFPYPRTPPTETCQQCKRYLYGILREASLHQLLSNRHYLLKHRSFGQVWRGLAKEEGSGRCRCIDLRLFYRPRLHGVSLLFLLYSGLRLLSERREPAGKGPKEESPRSRIFVCIENKWLLGCVAVLRIAVSIHRDGQTWTGVSWQLPVRNGSLLAYFCVP